MSSTLATSSLVTVTVDRQICRRFARALACRDSARYQLCGVAIAPAAGGGLHAVATDGKVLGLARVGTDDLPADCSGQAPTPIIIPRGWLCKLSSRPGLLAIDIPRCDDEPTPNYLDVTIRDVETGETIRPVQGSFPDYRWVLDAATVETLVPYHGLLDPRKIGQVCEALGYTARSDSDDFAAMHTGWQPEGEPGKPIIWHTGDAAVLVMPLVTGNGTDKSFRPKPSRQALGLEPSAY